MKSSLQPRALIALAVAAVLSAGAFAPQAVAATSSPAVSAQADECQRRGRRDSAQPEERYPNATRTAPDEGASARMAKRLNRLNSAMEAEEYAEVIEVAGEIIAQERANEYDKAYAANIAGHASYNMDDVEGAKRYINQAIELDAL